jgi:hypothetical protein
MISGQAETLPEFWASWNNGHRHVVGNLSDTVNDPNAVALVKSGQMLYSNEFYWNQDKTRKPDNHGLPVVCLVVASYDGHGDGDLPNAWNPTIRDYKVAGYLPPGSGIYEPGADEQDMGDMP